jgi:hypothetical protein
MSSFPADYADFFRRFPQKDFMAGVCKNQRGQRAFNPRKSAGNINGASIGFPAGKLIFLANSFYY